MRPFSQIYNSYGPWLLPFAFPPNLFPVKEIALHVKPVLTRFYAGVSNKHYLSMTTYQLFFFFFFFSLEFLQKPLARIL